MRCIEPSCNEMKDIEEFALDRTRKYNRAPRCKSCAYKRLMQWREDNPEKYAAQRARANERRSGGRTRKPARPWKSWAGRTRTNHKTKGCDVSGLPKGALEKMGSEATHCPICTLPLEWDKRPKRGEPGQPTAPTLDRVYNDTVLTPDNVWIVCARCNEAKGSMRFDEFLLYCRSVADRYEEWIAKLQEPEE
jgi:hypothetical protein